MRFTINLFSARAALSAASLCFISIASSTAAYAQEKAVVKDPATLKKLVGKHMLSLQWLQFAKAGYGSATVTQRNDELALKGEQRLAKGADSGYLTVDGKITEVLPNSFKFTGKIITCVKSINDGKECVRDGSFSFAAKGARKYWRLQEMQSPCSEVTDYVDMYF